MDFIAKRKTSNPPLLQHLKAYMVRKRHSRKARYPKPNLNSPREKSLQEDGGKMLCTYLYSLCAIVQIFPKINYALVQT